jgi:hypothetical protein
MRIGASLFLIAVGAILKYAITDHVNGVNLSTVGIILIIVGAVGLLFELIWWSTHRSTTVVSRDPYAEPPPRVERYERY